MSGIDIDSFPHPNDAGVKLMHKQAGYEPTQGGVSVILGAPGRAIHVHVIEELQEPFDLDVLCAPHELSGRDDAQRGGQVARQITTRECHVYKASDLESNYGSVDCDVLLPSVSPRVIDAYKSGEEDALDRDGDEEAHDNNCRD